jgi:dihydroxyacetone kinase
MCVSAAHETHHSNDTIANGSLDNRDIIKAAVETACEALIAAEPLITDYDSQVGDGDCGVTLVRGVKAVLAHVAGSREDGNAAWSMLSIAETIESNMDGTSGAVYGIFFTALAAALQTSKEASSPSALWQGAAASALGKLQQATPARRGDRTIMDALEPFVAALAEDCSVKNAVARAKDGMEATKGMRPAFGRAVYVEESAWDRVPDPGAYGVVCVLEAIRDAVLNKQV